MKLTFLIPLIVVILATVLLDPFMILMSANMVYTLLVLLFINFVFYALLIAKESSSDEREASHRGFAGRIAYLVGSGMMVAGIIYQAYFIHTVDSWLILALVAMTIAKYTALFIAEKFH